MFGRKKEEPQAPAETEAAAGNPVVGKGAPTPKRKDQVAARKRPLVPEDRKASKQTERLAMAEQRAKVRMAMETGNEQYMPVRDKGPQKRFARDFVDSRFSVGEFLMFGALIFVVASLVVPQRSDGQWIILAAFWVMFAVVFVDTFWLSRRLKKALQKKFGEVERGTVWYGSMRALQFRKLRLPKPMVSRGQRPQ